MQENSRKVMTVKAAAALIEGLSEYRLRQMCLNGQVKCIRAGRKILVTEAAVMRAVFGNGSESEQTEEMEKIIRFNTLKC